jgi:SprB repeat
MVSATLKIQAQTPLKVDAGPDTNHCLGDYTELRASVTGGVEPYTYLWTPDVELSATDVDAPIVSPTMHTVYKIVVTDAVGAVAKDEIKIKVSPKPNIFTNGTVTIQLGESITLMADAQGGTPPYNYSWKPTVGLTGSNSSNPVASPKYSTVYNVLVKDSRGCTNSGQVVVNISGDKSGSPTSQIAN